MKNKSQAAIALKQWMNDEGVKAKYLSKRLVCEPKTINAYTSGNRTPYARKAEEIETITQGAVPADQWGEG